MSIVGSRLVDRSRVRRRILVLSIVSRTSGVDGLQKCIKGGAGGFLGPSLSLIFEAAHLASATLLLIANGLQQECVCCVKSIDNVP